jgi:hypothetical protein
MSVAFHFLLLAIGEILKVDDYVTPQMLQDFLTREENFAGFRIPLSDCRLALQLMEESGFIVKYNKDSYTRMGDGRLDD